MANVFTIIIEEGYMKQKYDNDYTWLLQHTRKHLDLNHYDENFMSKDAAPKVGLNQDQHNLGI
jgi:hypothetical protein